MLMPFVAELMRERSPEDWMAERWRQALRWFFVNAPARVRLNQIPQGSQPLSQFEGEKQFQPMAPKTSPRLKGETDQEESKNGKGNPDNDNELRIIRPSFKTGANCAKIHESDHETLVVWKDEKANMDKARELIRVRHMSLATERSYLGWLKRFLRFCKVYGNSNPDQEALQSYLTHLAVREHQLAEAGVEFSS